MGLENRKYVIVIGTLDTKGPEVAYLRKCLLDQCCMPRVVDIGLLAPPGFLPDISRDVVAGRAGTTIASLLSNGTGKVEAMTLMARGVIEFMKEWIASDEVAGVISLGGGVGTWVGTKVMRSLPFGLPKVMVSTLPFDIRPHIGVKDIIIFPSIADILGLNPTLRTVLRNAAAAMIGMIMQPQPSGPTKPVIGVTGMGITTPAVLGCRNILEEWGYEITSFHTNGMGGSAFEEWIELDMFCSVLDLTTHEITSLMFNGVAKPKKTRLETAAGKGIPMVVGPGGLDFISRGPIETLDAKERKQPHYRHSPFFTHVRISAGGMKRVAETIAQKLDHCRAPTTVAIPMRGFSEQSRTGGALHDPEADAAFVAALKNKIRKDIRVEEIDAHINDEAFAQAACNLLKKLMNKRRKLQ